MRVEGRAGVKNPLLSIVKDDTESSYSAVGQTIHYTIVVTNTGNTTLQQGDGHRSRTRCLVVHPGERVDVGSGRHDQLCGVASGDAGGS